MIGFKVEGLQELQEALNPKVVRSAAASAINKTRDRMKTAASEKIREKYNLKKSDLNARFNIQTKASQNDLATVMVITGRPMSLSYFGAQQITGTHVVSGRKGTITRKKISTRMRSKGPLPRGVVVQVMRRETSYYRKAMIMNVTAGKEGSNTLHTGVFHPVSGKYYTPSKGKYKGKRGRTPIVERKLITIPSMFRQEQVQAAVWKTFQEKFGGIFAHEFEFYQSRASRGGR